MRPLKENQSYRYDSFSIPAYIKFFKEIKQENWVKAGEIYNKNKAVINAYHIYQYALAPETTNENLQTIVSQYQAFWNKDFTLTLVRLFASNPKTHNLAHETIAQSHIFKGLKDFELRSHYKLILAQTLKHLIDNNCASFLHATLDFLFGYDKLNYTPKIEKQILEHKNVKEQLLNNPKIKVVLEQIKLKYTWELKPSISQPIISKKRSNKI